jgi:hypothetical protein
MDHPLVDSDEWTSDDDVEPTARRRWPIVVVSIIIVIVAIGAAVYVAASHYQPLSQTLNGEYGSQILSSNGTLALNHPVGANSVNWTEPSGSFRVEVIVTINNEQRFPVTIDNVLAPANPSGNTDVHAYFDSTKTKQGAYGFKGGPTFTPTTLASKGQLQVVLHWTQQCVPMSAASGETVYTSVPVEFTFEGFHHTVNVPIDTVTISPRATC